MDRDYRARQERVSSRGAAGHADRRQRPPAKHAAEGTGAP